MKSMLSICLILTFGFSTTSAQSYFKYPETGIKKHYSLLGEQELLIVPDFINSFDKTKNSKEVKNKFNLHLLDKNQGLEVQKFDNILIEQTSIIDRDLADSLEKNQIENFFISQEVRHPSYYAELIVRKLDNWHERKLFASILVPETHGKLNQTSTEGAQGPWQVMPQWGRKFKVKNLQNPEQNLDTAIKVLNIHLADGKGDLWGRKGGMWGYNNSMDYVKQVKKLYDKIGSTTYSHPSVS